MPRGIYARKTGKRVVKEGTFCTSQPETSETSVPKKKGNWLEASIAERAKKTDSRLRLCRRLKSLLPKNKDAQEIIELWDKLIKDIWA